MTDTSPDGEAADAPRPKFEYRCPACGSIGPMHSVCEGPGTGVYPHHAWRLREIVPLKEEAS